MYSLSEALTRSLQGIQQAVTIVVVFLSTLTGLPINNQPGANQTASPSGENVSFQESGGTTRDIGETITLSPKAPPQTRARSSVSIAPTPGTAARTTTSIVQQETPGADAVVLRSVAPNSTNFGDVVTLTGQNFGFEKGTVWFTNNRGVNYGAIVSRWGDTEIVVTVPNFTGNQTVNVYIETTGQKRSNAVAVTIVEGQPIISSIAPQKPIIGGQLTIRGSGFGSVNGAVHIYEPTNTGTPLVRCEITSWSDTEVRCTLPDGWLVNKEYGISVVTGNNRKSSWVYATFECDPKGCG